MAGIAAAIIGAGALSAGASIFGASKAAKAQTSAANQAIAAQTGMFNKAVEEAQPFIDYGKEAGGTLAGLLKPGADMSSILKSIPGFKFLQDITQQGVANQATTTGLSGNTLLQGANAGNNIALSAGWVPIVNALQGLVTTGAGSASALGGQAVQTGKGIGGSLTGIGNAQAGAAMAGANAVGNFGNSVYTAMLLNKLLNQGGGGGNASQGMYGSNPYDPFGAGSAGAVS